jgi:hypothetical protein
MRSRLGMRRARMSGDLRFPECFECNSDVLSWCTWYGRTGRRWGRVRKVRYPTIDAVLTLESEVLLMKHVRSIYRTSHRVVLVFGLAWHE